MVTVSIPTSLSTIESLPDEILQQILRFRRADTSLRKFMNVLLVSKRFEKIGRPTAFEFLKLTNANFDKWYESTKYIGSQYAAVKHLTVHLTPKYPNLRQCYCKDWQHYRDPYVSQNHQYCGWQCLNYHDPDLNGLDWDEVIQGEATTCGTLPVRLKALSVALGAFLCNIVTLSVVLQVEPEDGPWCLCYETFIDNSTIAEILKNLSATCKNLMLDLGCYDYCQQYPREPRSWKNCAMCDILREKMTQLEHMWIRATSLCTWFFLPNHRNLAGAFKLRSSFETWLATESPEFWRENQLQRYTNGEDRKGCWMHWNSLPQDKRDYYAELSSAAVDNIAKPSDILNFPNLKSLTINYAMFPRSFNDDDTAQIAKFATALRIAQKDWQLFPELRAGQLVAQHSEDLTTEEIGALVEAHLPRDPPITHASEVRHRTINPGFVPFSELFVLDAVNQSTTILPFRFLTPEFLIPVEKISQQRFYGYYDLTSEQMRYGSFRDLDTIVRANGLMGWISTVREEITIPRSVALQIEQLRLPDLKSSFPTLYDVKEVLSKEGKNRRWIRRAEASVVQRHIGFLDQYEARDPSTGSLETQRPYEP